MFFDINELRDHKIYFDQTLQPGSLDLLDEHVRLASAGNVKGVAELVNVTLSEIRVRGHLQVTVGVDCDRCLAEYLVPIDSDFDLLYMPNRFMPTDPDLEVSGDDLNIGFYEGEGIELSDVLREHILLSLPMRRLCKEDCKGLCPMCGQDLNERTCDCKPETFDERWAPLKELRLKLTKSS